MGTLLFLAGVLLAGWYGYRWSKTSDSQWAQIFRVLVWGEDRPRKPG